MEFVGFYLVAYLGAFIRWVFFLFKKPYKFYCDKKYGFENIVIGSCVLAILVYIFLFCLEPHLSSE
jgi:hypothetical protein